MLSTVRSGSLVGIDALPVDVEVNAGEQGEPRPVLVGLPTSGVRESVDRVWSAIGNCGLRLPHYRVTINLAPGHLRKEGPLYDLPIALGLLAATSQLKSDLLAGCLIAGELSLSGETRTVRGGLALALLAKEAKLSALLLPPRTAEEAALVKGVDVYRIESLQQACAFLEGRTLLDPLAPSIPNDLPDAREAVDFCEVKGQQIVRRAVEVAVAGGHNILISGPPGSGKSMIAKRIPTIMPDLTEKEYLDILRVYSAGGKTLESNLLAQRPFRNPHHTISDVGLIGGGSIPGPGEVSLAHHGVLFLDELPEFKRSALEVLRQPLEDGQVSISRSAGKITLPARFMLVAAMNPDPAGGDPNGKISTPNQIRRYQSKLSGPLLDRFDIQVEAPALPIEDLSTREQGESSAAIRARVTAARAIQRRRFGDGGTNAAMSVARIREHCALTPPRQEILHQAMERLQLSARAYDRILKVSRTIADLANSPEIQDHHLFEAIQYRTLDRQRTF